MMPIKRRGRGLGEPEPDYSLGFYPDPPSHDFCVWLIIAELMRRHHKAPAPLKVKFGLINGQLGTVDFGPLSPWQGRAYQCGLSREYHDQMMEHVLKPAIEMIGAVEEAAVHAPFNLSDLINYVEYDYHIGHLVDAGREGHDIPRWMVPQWARDEVREYLGGKTPVVITLREANAQPERNSRISEWLKFADYISGDYGVLFLRDTCRADDLLGPFQTWPIASRNVYVRAALYERALVNMFVGNGPSIWCIFSNSPYMIFKQLIPELPHWAHGQQSGWKDQDHMEINDQYPWALPTQRLTWTDDTFENMRDAFETFLKVKS